MGLVGDAVRRCSLLSEIKVMVKKVKVEIGQILKTGRPKSVIKCFVSRLGTTLCWWLWWVLLWVNRHLPWKSFSAELSTKEDSMAHGYLVST